MRCHMTFAAFLWFGLVACGGGSGSSSSPPPPGEAEVPRGAFELLLESLARSGERSYWTMAADGARVARYAGLPEDARQATPSPDGRTLAYLLPTIDGDLHLWVMNRDGSNPRLVLGGTRLVEHLAWSADGSLLAIAGSTFDESDDIWTLRADGTGLRHLTPDPRPAIVADRAPQWSPDGSTIVFQSNRTGFAQIWLMDADGGNPRLLVEDGQPGFGPVWSPDGTTIAFLVPGEGIALVAAQGSDKRILPVAGDPQNLAWTPEGRLLYSADLFGDREIFALDPATQATANLTVYATQDLRAVPFVHVQPGPWRGLAAPARYPANRPGATGLVVADVIADDRADVLVADEDFAQVRVYRGTDAGLVADTALELARPMRAMSRADLSRDGIEDLAILTDDAVLVWRGAASGLQPPTEHPLTGTGQGLAVADFDLDGSADFAALHDRSGSGLRMLVHSVSSADARIQAVLDYGVDDFLTPGHAAAGDIDRDAAPDVVLATSGTQAPIVVVPGQGDISFGAAFVGATGLPAARSNRPLLMDLDGDRRDDLVLLVPGEEVYVALANGSGFGSARALQLAATAMAGGDLDRDGDNDLILGLAAEVVFLRNRGDAEFARPVTLLGAVEAAHLAIADLDADLWPDLVFVESNGSLGTALNLGR